jgi:hypothetical protein
MPVARESSPQDIGRRCESEGGCLTELGSGRLRPGGEAAQAELGAALPTEEKAEHKHMQKEVKAEQVQRRLVKWGSSSPQLAWLEQGAGFSLQPLMSK